MQKSKDVEEKKKGEEKKKQWLIVGQKASLPRADIAKLTKQKIPFSAAQASRRQQLYKDTNFLSWSPHEDSDLNKHCHTESDLRSIYSSMCPASDSLYYHNY